jgi:hypothetical protein
MGGASAVARTRFGSLAAGGKVERKQFFFERKNHKTYVPGTGRSLQPQLTIKSFLVLFFKKELLSSLIHAPGCGAPCGEIKFRGAGGPDARVVSEHTDK